ncbi:hypothetical protein AB0H83_34355 [Dactylosporangium sp. NPDC050688]|uniref:hypothetical protein n=1 Tax=Dactylosporangium sp. NPDC050688 TaxID=3157217 RepID=UPI0033E715FC
MTILVTQWVAGNTPYTYAGDVAAPANDLGCSTVIQLDGRVTIAGKAARSG